ncbi:MAG: C-GCAxxG-C-C family protein [Muribaculum sp.]|nr:C-GCAxxG-C-C family protein [Muribaculum sp.]
MKHTLESRIERARELRKQGYTCSQCVVMAFDDVHNLSEEAVAAISIGLGGGVGGQHQACGTITGMAVVSGFMVSGNPSDKQKVYASIKDMCSRFVAKNGSIVCGELLADRANRKPCMQYIEDSVEILHNAIEAGGN